MPIKPLIRALRPHHWVKNLIITGPLVFSMNMFHPEKVMLTAIAIALFSAVASAIYLINDIADREKDRQHPTKKHRPIAAGTCPVPLAWVVAALLSVGGLVAAWMTNRTFAIILLLYLINNLAYSFHVKRVVILDVMALALGFVLRVLGGAQIIDVPASEWLVMCTILLAMFLGFAKRRNEITLLAGSADAHRKVLDDYSAYFLDQMIMIAGAATVVSYALYTVSPHTISQFGTEKLIYTVPFVLYGLFRYLYLVHQKDSGGNPTKILTSDKPTLINVGLWLVASACIIYRTPIQQLFW